MFSVMVKMRFSRFVFLITFVMIGSYCEQVMETNREDWIDPADMINFDPVGSVKPKKVPKPKQGEVPAGVCASLQNELSHCYKDFEKSSELLVRCEAKAQTRETPSCDTPYFKQLVRRLLESVKKNGQHDVSIQASQYELQTLETYVNTDKENIQDASEVVFNILSNVKASNHSLPNSSWKLFLRFLNKEITIIMLFAVISITSVVALQLKLQVSWWQLACVMFIASFFLSIPWEWFRLYRIEFAKKQAEIVKAIPKHCQPEHKLSIMETFKWWGTYMFSVTDDTCAKYQEAFLVDPLWEVTPSRAVSVTITRFFVQPLEYIADAAGKSFRALFKEVPVQWQPFVFISILVIMALFLFFISGAQIRTPFLTVGNAPFPLGRGDVTLGRIEGRLADIATKVEQLQVQQVAIQEALPDENYPDVHNGFERMAEVMAALRERNVRQEGEFLKLREYLMQRGNNVILESRFSVEQEDPSVAGDDGRVKQSRVLARPRFAREIDMVNGEVGRGASTYEEKADKKNNFRPVENIGSTPTQESKQPTEESASTTSSVED